MSDTTAPRRQFLTRQEQAKRYKKSVRTIERWGEDPEMGLPPEYDFNGRKHREESELTNWERSRVCKQHSA
jgi:hypothetical protein